MNFTDLYHPPSSLRSIIFQFKQFAIRQDRTPMKVGTDGVLLGAWANLENADSVLDIGTGTGLIALMAAQRNSSARIDALEIEPDAYRQACENIGNSPWPQRINVIQTALQDYDPGLLYDSIVCNPPFFTDSTKAPDKGRSLARHCDTLPHTELVENIARLLKPDGNFCVILPVGEALDLMAYAFPFQLYPERITQVIPNPGKPPKRYLIKFISTPVSTCKDEIIVELSRHEYSEEYQKLTRDFYLHF